jgi:hypothetical protein
VTISSPGSGWSNLQGSSASEREILFSQGGETTGFITIDKPVYEVCGNTDQYPAIVNFFSVSNEAGSSTDSDGDDYATIGFAI